MRLRAVVAPWETHQHTEMHYCPKCNSSNTQSANSAFWIIFAAAIVVDLVGRRFVPDPMRFDSVVVGISIAFELILVERVCADCGYQGKEFMFLLWRWL